MGCACIQVRGIGKRSCEHCRFDAGLGVQGTNTSTVPPRRQKSTLRKSQRLRESNRPARGRPSNRGRGRKQLPSRSQCLNESGVELVRIATEVLIHSRSAETQPAGHFMFVLGQHTGAGLRQPLLVRWSLGDAWMGPKRSGTNLFRSVFVLAAERLDQWLAFKVAKPRCQGIRL